MCTAPDEHNVLPDFAPLLIEAFTAADVRLAAPNVTVQLTGSA
jgi:hypothetical protein